MVLRSNQLNCQEKATEQTPKFKTLNQITKHHFKYLHSPKDFIISEYSATKDSFSFEQRMCK